MFQLTKNFNIREFYKKDNQHPDTPYQWMLVQEIASQLQIVRDDIKDKIFITSGVRVLSDFDRLVKHGYKPSITSDHYYGSNITFTNHKSRKTVFFGNNWYFSVGAVDIYAEKTDLDELFARIKMLAHMGKIQVGQVIKEPTWIHMSNSRSNIHRLLIENKILPSDTEFLVFDGREYHHV